MLITCPECGREISDKAQACPGCGYPISGITIAPKKRAKKSRHKLPNGFGSIKKLSNAAHRAKPYAAYPPVKNYNDRGYPIYDKPIGYFHDWNSAYRALDQYNKHPYQTGLMFRDVYNMWWKEKFELGKKKYSNSTKDCAKAGYYNSEVLHNMLFKDIKPNDLQQVLDNCTLKHASVEHIKNLFKQLYKYALKYDIVDKDCSAYIQINQEDDDEKGIPFTSDELKKIWMYKESYPYDTILILCYTGFRIKAMVDIKTNLEQWYFQGGVKTKAGKNRIVPIHSKIQDLVKKRIDLCQKIITVQPNTYRIDFASALSEIGITGHTPHDCRDTFASLLDDAGVNNNMIKRLMGHSLADDITQDKYVSKDIKALRQSIEMIKIDCY